ncbi:hypothetical protein TREMEDRAFT_66993 [Tremella mesenterica DSM 1558]|uniref:uncharacterized protein n=1 Tax=Tremella mesenterica (strain ATCC 24925 / CBS 8224 / DSM 1558 / NBRC 9311 / NRRL Y-6157 / RJB 2259-6 / UBC 559-6) TaxID=578456 RepID=UPI0003F49E6F|nr:uncharacterized protein TREMEDRAFT_66993 [Tremella mesenterica DSM 1558]EIW72675.1 hypothetical protein TREMEDRAFT_66993 [Tremella mesenterica DSM 1558]
MTQKDKKENVSGSRLREPRGQVRRFLKYKRICLEVMDLDIREINPRQRTFKLLCKLLRPSLSGSNANGFSEADLQALEDDSLTKSTSDLVTGGLPYIIEDNDEGYLCEIQAGTPPKSFLMIMDTGSSDTWLPDAACSNCGSHLTLGTDTSSTFKASDQVFTVTYGSGEVNGTLCQDDLTIAGMTLKAHTFGTVTSESSQFSKTFADGLMGLAFDTLSQQRVDTPVESLVQAGLIKEGILGIALGRVADGQNDGELVFGRADSSKLDASTTQTLPVTSQNGFWQVALGGVTVDGKVVSQQRQAILDTGTTLLLAPQQDQGMFSIPCTTDAVVEMTFGNVAFQIDPRDLIFQPLNNADPTGQCLSSVMAGTVTDDQTWLMGDVLLKNLYMATDVGQRTISLSARTDTPGSSSGWPE